jgi:predicted dehydrogenase
MVFYPWSQREGNDAQEDRDASQGIALHPPPVNPYWAEIEEFSQAILEGRESRLGGSEGLRSRKILEGCYELANTSGIVVIRS